MATSVKMRYSWSAGRLVSPPPRLSSGGLLSTDRLRKRLDTSLAAHSVKEARA